MALLFTFFITVVTTFVPRMVRAHEPYPGLLMELLEKPTANRTLITTIVNCLDDPTGRKTTSAFLRCVNDHLHVHQRTKFDSSGFILGNYLIKSATKMYVDYDNDLPEGTKAFGDCAPMLLRNLFGVDEFSFSCKKRTYIKGYDESDDDDFDEDNDDIEE